MLGHRGASTIAQENTIAAFVGACRLGADGIELDVRRTADGALAVHHDARLDDGRVIAELARADLPDSIPDLQSVLDACLGVIINIEIKNSPFEPGYDPDEGTAAAVAELVAGRPDTERDLVIVSSFTLPTVDAVKAAAPAIRTGVLVLPGADPHWAVDVAVEHGHDAIHPEYRTIEPPVVTHAHDAGLTVAAWTVDDPDKMRELVEWDVDIIITNQVETAIAALH